MEHSKTYKLTNRIEVSRGAHQWITIKSLPNRLMRVNLTLSDQRELKSFLMGRSYDLGDDVLIGSKNHGLQNQYIGKIGTVVGMDQSLTPYQVRFKDGQTSWFKEENLKPTW